MSMEELEIRIAKIRAAAEARERVITVVFPNNKPGDAVHCNTCECYDLRAEPTVDDLASWLRANHDVFLETDLRHEDGYVILYSAGYSGTPPQPSLLAALKSAVLTLSKETP